MMKTIDRQSALWRIEHLNILIASHYCRSFILQQLHLIPDWWTFADTVWVAICLSITKNKEKVNANKKRVEGTMTEVESNRRGVCGKQTAGSLLYVRMQSREGSTAGSIVSASMECVSACVCLCMHAVSTQSIA